MVAVFLLRESVTPDCHGKLLGEEEEGVDDVDTLAHGHLIL